MSARRRTTVTMVAVLAAALALALDPARAAGPLTTLDYRVVGVSLRPARANLAIPKNLPGAVRIELIAGGSGALSLETLAEGAIVEATLRGPSFPARRVVGLPNADLALPPLPLVGDYSLDDLRLVDVATGATRLDGSPRSVPIQVFDELLVSRVTSRPLSLDEIEARGIAVDASSFRALEFEVGFVLDGQTVPVRFPVVAPRFDGPVELIPRAELEEMLAEAEAINSALSLGAELPPELETAGLDVQVKGVNFQFVEPIEAPDLALSVPPIPGLVVIPGRIGMLNQFFSVMLFTENAAPAGSGLSVHGLRATLELPDGQDRIPGTHAAPGDDPLRFARVGPDAVTLPEQPVRGVGRDGELGTADDVDRLLPGATGQAEFLVEGLKEGLHVMDITIDGTLDGLGTKEHAIRGFASGSVLVRNPKFSLAFTHPRTIRTGEPYTASVTVLNTSPTPANLVTVTLPEASLSGARFEPGTSSVVELGTILPGETATGEFRLRAQRTGAITFSNLTSDSDIVGRFRLRMGVDERGVELSPDAIGYPDYAEDLRIAAPAVFDAIERYLGQALSVSTAAQLPPGVARVSRGALERRVVEIAEAGQRLRYGDGLDRVLADLLLDLQGARSGSEGLDQIWRETDAGRELREALLAALATASAIPNAVDLLTAHAPDLAGRGEAWLALAVDAEAWQPSLELLGAEVTLGDSAIGAAAGFSGAPSAAVDGHWIVARPLAAGLRLVAGEGGAPAATLVQLDLAGDGSGRLLRWSLPALPAGGCVRGDVGGADLVLEVDETCNGTVDSTLAPAIESVAELPPEALGAVQDEQVLVARPSKPCPRGDIRNYGNVVAVLFSKPMTQASVDVAAAYALDGGNAAKTVQIQPGGRVALITLVAPIGTLRARTLSIDPSVADPRGNPLAAGDLEVATTAVQGVAVDGRVVRGTGEPAVDVPVTLTMYDEVLGFVCEPYVVRASQVRTDAAGRFSFDYVPAGIPYSVSATDTSGIGREAEALVLDASSDEQLDRARLLEVAGGSAQGTLLEQFAVGALPEAIARAEGLDRALFRDSVAEGSARVGTTVPVALRFRGRGTVTGTVLGADAATPVANAAVNLFPDPDSRELGRGVFSDANGRFAFQGVPLGAFTVEATSSAGRSRTVSGALLGSGELVDVPVVLSAAVIERSALEGRVVEIDDGSPHAGARVFVGRFVENEGFTDVVAIATSDDQGFWRAEGIPVGIRDLVAASFDGRRSGERRNVAVVSGSASFTTIALQSRTTVRGRVEFANGQPAANALVGGGEAIVRSDAQGFFTLTGVPTGPRSIEAAVEADPASGIEFTRLGSAQLNVIPGVENFVTVRLRPAGRIVGRVIDANGAPVPNVNVSIPAGDGFLWVPADGEGRFVFENIGLDDYLVSAPAPPVSDTDVTGILDVLSGSPGSDEMLAAITRAFEIFTGVNDPLLNGEGQNFNPGDWGYTETSLDFDGQTQVIEVQYLPRGTVSGTVRNGQGVPIGARVRLTGVGPTSTGDKGFVIRGERNSDPAVGTFSFAGELLAGDWGLQAASPFFPAAISTSGQTNRIDPDATGIVLQFPDGDAINGRLTGTVFDPDGAPVPPGVAVQISFGDDYVIRTVEGGRFDTQFDLPAVNAEGERISYEVAATDASGLRGQAIVALQPGVTTDVAVHLLAKGGLRVRVLDGEGNPAAGAAVTIDQFTFPFDDYTGTTDAQGELVLGNLFEGGYAVGARFATGPTAVEGRSNASVTRGQETLATVRLGPTGTIRGRFVARDGVTPIAAAQVRVGTIGFAATDDAGAFEVQGVPLGTHVLRAQDAVTGRAGVLPVTLSLAGEVRDVRIVERALGAIEGFVISGFGNATVPAASVTLSFEDAFDAPRTVTADPAGFFEFPSAPAGRFELTAKTAPAGPSVPEQIGSVSGVLREETERLRVDVPLRSLANLTVEVREADGSAASGASVTVGGVGADTDASGRARFTDLLLGEYEVRAQSRVPGRSRSVGVEAVRLDQRAGEVSVAVTLSGVGRVEGMLFASDGTTPLSGRVVELAMSGGLAGGNLQDVTAADGTFGFDDVAIGDFRLVARDVALAASDGGAIAADGEVAEVDLVLGPSGTVGGRLVSQDGTAAIEGAEMVLFFSAPSGALGRAVARTSADGTFAFDAIPVGAFALETFVFERDGIVRLAGEVTADGEHVDFGDVRLDEQAPRVVATEPLAGDEQVSIDQTVRLTLSEALDPAEIDPRAIFVRSAAGSAPAQVTLELDPASGEPRVLAIDPDAPLASETDYQVVVVDGTLVSAIGEVIAEGPVDLVGRPLATAFAMSFRTRDQDPPGLLSIAPEDGAVQVDQRAVVRLSFDEPLSPAGISVALTGPSGPVAGRVDVGVGARVVVFTPNALLAPNATYTARIDGVRDIAGNLAEGLPFSSSFATLDTLGPAIAQLALAGAPTGGATRDVVATLVQPEAGVSIRLSADLVTVGQSAPNVLAVPFTFPLAGSTVLRAIAIDRFGNEGPIAELPVSVIANQPPSVSFTRLAPAAGPVPSGSALSVRVSASDDVGVSLLKAVAEGAGSAPFAQSNGAPITLNVAVPASAGPGSAVVVQGEAIDGNGQSSGEQSLAVAVSDGTSPSVSFTAPAAGSELVPGSTLAVALAGDDNFGVTRFELVAEGAFAAAQSQDVAGSPGAAAASFSLDVPADVEGGSSVTLRARAFDAAGLSGVATLVLTAPDLRAPRLQELVPADGSTVGASPPIAARFDEPIARASVAPTSLRLRDAANAIVPAAIGFAEEDRVVTLTPQAPLASGATFRVVLTGGMRDLAGNLAADAEGSPLLLVEHAFTVGAAALTAPAAGTRVIEGQGFEAAVAADASLGALSARFLLNGALAATAGPGAGGEFRASLTAPTLAASGGPALRVAAELELPGGATLAAGEVTLALLAASGDEDGDGIPNGQELALGLDPFADDRTLDSDGDGLSNTDEVARGTNPRTADSDGDGLADGAEIAAGLDPLDPDSDDDGLPDGQDVLGGPRVISIEPNAGAANVSVRPRLRVRFDEPLDRATVTAASFALLEGGAAPVAGDFVFGEGDRVVDLVPAAPLAFSTGYTLRITSALVGTDGEPIRNTDGSDVTAPIERSFTTGAFGLTEPAGGASVRELQPLALAAAGNASLGIASVRFEVNGAAVATDTAAPFEASFAVPAANVVPALAITAIALDAGGVELARDTISVTVVVGLDVASRVFGVPLGATRDLVLRLPVPRSEPLAVTITSADPAVASAPAQPQTIPAGATELRVPITGVAEGATSILATTLEDQVSVAVSVSALASGTSLEVVAPPVGSVIVPFPSAGDVIVPVSSTRTVTLRILTAPAAVDTGLVIESSDPAVAQIEGPVVIPAGSTDATFTITTGAAGTALLTLVAGDEGRELRVISGAPSPENTPPVVAPPIGITIVPFPSAGDVIVSPSSTRTVTLRILTEPAVADTELIIVSSDPGVASIAGPVVIAAGATDATFTITTGAAGTALLTLVAGDEGRELRVISGAPSPENTPPVVAPPIGITIVPFPSAGDVIVSPSSTRTVTLRILTEPAVADTELVIVSSDPGVASIAGPVVIAAGQTDATFEITTGAAGTATVTLIAGDEGRELRVISGAPSPANTPPVLAPPIGVTVIEAGNAGTLYIDPGDTRTFALPLLPFPSPGDLPVTATSLDPSVATVAPGAQVIPTGESAVTLTVTATAAAEAETRIDLQVGVDRRTLRVVIGVPGAATTAVAPPVGIEIEEPPAGGE